MNSKQVLFRLERSEAQIAVSIGSTIETCEYRRNRSFKINHASKFIELDLFGTLCSSFTTINTLNAIIQSYQRKQLTTKMIVRDINDGGTNFRIHTQVIRQKEALPTLFLGYSDSRTTKKLVLSFLIVNQLGSAIVKAMNWFSPPADWIGFEIERY